MILIFIENDKYSYKGIELVMVLRYVVGVFYSDRVKLVLTPILESCALNEGEYRPYPMTPRHYHYHPLPICLHTFNFTLTHCTLSVSKVSFSRGTIQ